MDPLRLLQPELERVDQVIAARLAEFDLSPTDVRALSYAGGKRLRARLLIHSAQVFLTEVPEAAIRLAASVEVIHLASLIHDDIIDAAETRRARPSARSLLGDGAALALGDLVFAVGLECACSAGLPEATHVLAEALCDMCNGERVQVQRRRDLTLSSEDYLDIVSSKTGALMRAACAIGGIVGGGEEAGRRALARFGLAFGTAYQILDDCNDLDAPQRGREAGQDLSRGEITLPVILLLGQGGPSQNLQELVRRAFGHPSPRLRSPPSEASAKEGECHDALSQVVRLASDSGSLESARRTALSQLDQALSHLDALDDGRSAKGLRALAAYYAKGAITRPAEARLYSARRQASARVAVEEHTAAGGRQPTGVGEESS